MKIIKIENIIKCGSCAFSKDWSDLEASIHKEIRQVNWPLNNKSFIIYPESGKKRGEGNGVKPIKDGLMNKLKDLGWKCEVPLDIKSLRRGVPPVNCTMYYESF